MTSEHIKINYSIYITSHSFFFSISRVFCRRRSIESWSFHYYIDTIYRIVIIVRLNKKYKQNERKMPVNLDCESMSLVQANS